MVRVVKVFFGMFVVLFIVLCVVLTFFLVTKLGISGSSRLTNVIYSDVAVKKIGFSRFMPKYVSEIDDGKTIIFGQYGLFVANVGNDIWILAVDGLKHFIQASSRDDSPYFYSLDSCTEKENIGEIIRFDGSVKLMEYGHGQGVEGWLETIKVSSLNYVFVNYYIGNESSPSLYYTGVHSLNGLIYENDPNFVCLN